MSDKDFKLAVPVKIKRFRAGGVDLDADSGGLCLGPPSGWMPVPGEGGGVTYQKIPGRGFEYKIPERELHFFSRRKPEHYGESWTELDVHPCSFFDWDDSSKVRTMKEE